MAQTDWPPTEPPEVVLAAGSARLAVDLRGGGLRRLVVDDWDVLDGYPAGAVGGGWRGGVLVPPAHRVGGGRGTWHDRVLQLDVNSAEQPNAIHGLVAWQPWAVLERTSIAASVGTILAPHLGYPFRLAVSVDYDLGPDRLAVTVRVRNTRTAEAPGGIGMDPSPSPRADHG